MMISTRRLFALLFLFALSPDGRACSCFPPELRARTAQETLEKSYFAALVRAVEAGADGKARVQVLESFKGPATGAILEAGPGTALCAGTSFVAGEEALVLSFEASRAACNKYAPTHFLLEGLRSNANQEK